MTGGFPLDLLLFGMIAAFLVLRLRGILGRRTGFERPSQTEKGGPVPVPGLARTAAADVAPAGPARPLPAAGSPQALALEQMRGIDRAFDPEHFLRGAEAAFRMIVDAFARGDRVTLRPLLTDGTFRSFEQVIAAREAAGQTQRSEVRGIEHASIETAVLEGTVASITVRFVSDQVAETLGADGKPVAGADAVAELTDLWTFERDLQNPDPAWRLAAARSG